MSIQVVGTRCVGLPFIAADAPNIAAVANDRRI